MKKRWQISLLLLIIIAGQMGNKTGDFERWNSHPTENPRQSSDTPIYISDEGELAAAADRGSGISSDPYVIENKIFNVSDIGSTPLLLTGTTSFVTIQNITIFGNAVVGIQIYLVNVPNVWIRNCTFTDIGTGIYLDGTDIDNVNISECIFQDNTVNSPGSAGVYGRSWITPNGIRIWNNTLRNLDTPGLYFREVGNLTIYDNYFDTLNHSHSAISIYDINSTGTESSNIVIRNNTIKNIGGTGSAISVEADTLVIKNNTLENARGISVYSSSNVTIENNVLDTSASPGGVGITVTGSSNLNSTNVAVLDNSLQKFAIGLNFASTQNITAAHNWMDSTGMADSYGILSSSADFQNYTLDGNHINNTRQAVYLNGPSNGTIINNIFNNSLTSTMYCPFDLSNTSIYGNEFYNTGSSHLSLGAGAHEGLVFDNGAVGNYWDDYKTRYPAATHNGLYYSIPYDAGSAAVYDYYPTIGDEQPTADFLLNTTALIAGQSVEAVFTGEVGNLIADYQWNFGEVVGNETGANPVYIYTSGGTFDVSLTVVDTDGDSATVTKPAHVSVDPDYQPSATFTQNATQIFEGESIQFTFTGMIGNGGETYEWDFGDGTSHSPATDPEHTYTSAGNYTVTLTVVDTDGDVVTNPVTDLIEVIVDLVPVASFSVSDTTVIAGESSAFTFTGDPGNGGETYEWDFGDGSDNETVANPTHIYTTPGAFNVTLTVTDADGDANVIEMEDYITVIPDLSPSASFSQDATTVIQGTGIHFTFTGDPGNGGETYQWNFGDGPGNNTDQNPLHLYADPGVYTVTLSVSDTDGDMVTNEMVNHITVIEDVDPTASFTQNVTHVVEGEIIQFNFTGEHGNLPVTYQWDFGDGSDNSTLASPSHRYTTSGEYTVTLTVVDADGDVAVSTILITVTPYTPVSAGLPPWAIILISIGAVAVVGGVTTGVILKRKKAKIEGKSDSPVEMNKHPPNTTGPEK